MILEFQVTGSILIHSSFQVNSLHYVCIIILKKKERRKGEGREGKRKRNRSEIAFVCIGEWKGKEENGSFPFKSFQR